MAEVTVRNVVKRYGTVQVMHGVSVDIEDGQFVVLVGPSGCGKSTLLRMIAGLETISDGEIAIGGRVVNDVMPKDRDIAMVFQSYALYPHKTVAREHGLRAQDQGRARRPRSRRRSAGPPTILDLGHLLDRYPKQLSGGQRQRVAMGRAIVRDPAVFLFDEPLSNLDAKLRVAMRVEIKELHQRLGTTIVYVTHDQIEAMTMADKIVVMRDGRVEQVGAPLELYDNPANVFVAGFIGSPAMNFIKGKVDTPTADRRPRRRRRRLPLDGAARRATAAPSSTASAPSISPSARAASPPASRCSSPPARRPRSSPGIGERPDRRGGQGPHRRAARRRDPAPHRPPPRPRLRRRQRRPHLMTLLPSRTSASSSPAPARASAAPPRSCSPAAAPA